MGGWWEVFFFCLRLSFVSFLEKLGALAKEWPWPWSVAVESYCWPWPAVAGGTGPRASRAAESWPAEGPGMAWHGAIRAVHRPSSGACAGCHGGVCCLAAPDARRRLLQWRCLLGSGLLLASGSVALFTFGDCSYVARADEATHTNSGRGLLRALGLWQSSCARLVQSPARSWHAEGPPP